MRRTVTASAPGRANLIGEHIDYAGGVVLPFAISARTSVQISTREDDSITLESEGNHVITSWGMLASDELPTWSKYPLGILHFASLIKAMPGLDIKIKSNVPQGAGLSSSAALECATAAALNQLFELNIAPIALAKLAQRAEREFVGVPCGLMDQAASTLAQSGKLLAFDCADESYSYLDFDLAGAGLAILLIDSKVKHALVDGGYAARFEICQKVLTALNRENFRGLHENDLGRLNLSALEAKRIRHIMQEINRVELTEKALAGKDFELVGQLINLSHESLRDDYEVSCPELNLIQMQALENGALGARIMGGGFGGSAIALTPIEKIEEIKAAVLLAARNYGYPEPVFYVATPSDGVRIDAQN